MSDAHKNVGLRITSDPDMTSVTQPGAGAQRREAPMPLRLLLVADLVPQQRPSRTERQVRRVDATVFGELIAEWRPALRLDVPNRLSPQPQSLEIGLRFESLKDFAPAAIARQVPALARLLAIRTEVHGVRTKGTDKETFRERLGEAGVDAASADGLYAQLTVEPPKPKPAPKPKEDDPLDRLMGMVETGDGASEEAEGGLGDALADAVSDGAPRVASSAAEKILADFDQKLGGQLRAILEHPDLRRLEAAWRGLKLLVDRLPFRDGVLLDVLPARRESLSESLYYQVLLPEHEAEDEGDPLTAVILGFAFGNSQADVDLLVDIAETGASLQVPFIASAAPGFFGFEAPESIGSLPLVPQLVAGPEYIHWNKLREREDARHVALAFPPFLLRAPYGPDHPSKEVPIEEEGFLWGGGALAVGLAIADSFAETGWPTHLAGRGVGDLPLHETDRGQTPLATLLPEEKAAELADAGFAVLTGTPNRDRLRVAHAPNVSRPQTFDAPDKTAHAAAHATLACGLFTARAAHRILRLPDELDASASLEAKQEAVVSRLQSFLGGDVGEGAISAEPVPEAEIEGHDLLAVRLQPPRSVLDTPVHLAIGLPVPREA
jgi:type VI secretion system ImpC/EvpB family protein/type VI secretion system ImpB/VipA family protein